MKSFIYTITERTPRNGHTVYSIRVYRLKAGTPILVATNYETFVDEFQLFMMTAERDKLLPKRAFKRHQSGSYYYDRHGLRDSGIANVTSL